MKVLGMGLAALAVSAALVSPVLAQDDDWEFAEDASRDLTVAAARYESGQALVVQCEGETLKVILVGLPATTATSRRLEVARSDGATDVQAWTVRDGQALTSQQPSRDARFLRVGGPMQVRSVAEEAAPITTSFDLPRAHANLDRVLTACGHALENDRDALPRADPAMRLERAPPRGWQGGAPGLSLELSCIIRDGVYRECRADHWPEDMNRSNVRREANDHNGARVHPEDAEANEGRVVYIHVPLLILVRG